MPPTPTETEVSKYTNQFERCAIKCIFLNFYLFDSFFNFNLFLGVDKHVDLIPSLFKTMKSVLKKGSTNLPDA